jgi:hypothetical protein
MYPMLCKLLNLFDIHFGVTAKQLVVLLETLDIVHLTPHR